VQEDRSERKRSIWSRGHIGKLEAGLLSPVANVVPTFSIYYWRAFAWDIWFI
jgi:hypothetical protein